MRGHPNGAIEVARVVSDVSAVTGIDAIFILGRACTSQICAARQIAYYVAWHRHGMGARNLAKEFDRDPASVGRGITKTRARMGDDSKLRDVVNAAIARGAINIREPHRIAS